ncbi:MAG: hypothetical protein E7319_01770 [Clostridiales bacterium]|nr:hypothetical protein [Clostridiales bacterium]
MGKRRRTVLYTVLGLCLVGAIAFGISRSVYAGRMAQRLEDSYTQRVLESQEHLQAISLKLSKSPLAADARMQIQLLTEVSRQADAVVTGLSSLPLSHVAMSDTIKFCNQLADYAMQEALLVASGSRLSDEAIEQLSQLRDQCTLLLGQLAVAQENMLSGSLRMAEADDVYYEPAQLGLRPLEAVADQDHGMDYPTMIYDGAFSDASHYGEPKALGEGEIDARQAVEIARNYVGEERVREAVAAGETEGILAGYGVTLTLHDGVVLNAEVTRRGGKLLWLMPEHAAFSQEMTAEECVRRGGAFLVQHGYGEMEPNHVRVYDGLCVVNFVSVQDGVLLYPDLVKVQLRMDTGEVVGLESNNYLMNHHRRDGLTPTLSKEEALQRVSPHLGASDARLCVIPHLGGERLCYEIPGVYGENEYRVYIDAKSGEEVEILMMIQDSEGTLSGRSGPRLLG